MKVGRRVVLVVESLELGIAASVSYDVIWRNFSLFSQFSFPSSFCQLGFKKEDAWSNTLGRETDSERIFNQTVFFVLS